ncbi:hypothetical protein [Aquitalea pelogenes]|uniref:hypothetical protein n=1 Tax=Aquitalea pelogenes TaxID=1293573 RepID=UPI0035B31FB3
MARFFKFSSEECVVAVTTSYANSPPITKTLHTQQSTPSRALHQYDLPDFFKRLASFDGNKQTALMMELALLTFTRVGELQTCQQKLKKPTW